MRFRSSIVLSLGLVVAGASLPGAIVVALAAAPKKAAPKPKPKPTATPTSAPDSAPTWVEDKPESPPPKPAKGKDGDGGDDDKGDDDGAGTGGKGAVELAACPADSVLDSMEPKALATLVRKKCRTLKVPATAAPTEISGDDLLVAICVRSGEAIAPKDCDLAASLLVSSDDGVTPLQFVDDGEYALSLTTRRIDKAASPDNGTRFTQLRRDFFQEGRYPASALIGIKELARPEMMIEIQAIAVVD